MKSELFSYILSISPEFRKPSRLSSLYSDFTRLKSTNPDGYTANIVSWQSVLSRALLAGRIPSSPDSDSHDLLTLHVNDALKCELETKDGSRPVGLGWVVTEGLKSKAMMPLKDFLLARESVYSRDWSEMPWRILEWGLEKVGLVAWNGEKVAFGEFVILGNVEEVAKRVLKQASAKHASPTDRIYSLEMFKAAFGHIMDTEDSLSDTDFGVLLTFLQRDKGAISYDGKTIKFPSSRGQLEPITAQDTSIASLLILIASLRQQTSSLNTRISTLTTQAQTSLTLKNRTTALSALRSRKLVEGTLKQRSDTLAQLEEVLAGIEQASDQAEIVTVLEGSRDVLRALNKQVGGVERVEDVLEDLREEMGKADEVGAVIREGATVGIDEDEIDEELAAMEVDGRREREEQAVEERKAREGKEAEETRKQLAEIEKEKMYETVEPGESEPRMDGSVGNTNAPQETKVSSTTESYANIEDSMKRLSQMSIEDFEPPKGLVPSREQRHQEPFQAIPAD